LRPRRDILHDYKTVLEAVYEPTAYFERVRLVGRALNRPNRPEKFDLKAALHDFSFLIRLVWRMPVGYVIIMITFYLHLGTFAPFVNKDLVRQMAVEEKKPRAPSISAVPVIPAPAAVASFG